MLKPINNSFWFCLISFSTVRCRLKETSLYKVETISAAKLRMSLVRKNWVLSKLYLKLITLFMAGLNNFFIYLYLNQINFAFINYQISECCGFFVFVENRNKHYFNVLFFLSPFELFIPQCLLGIPLLYLFVESNVSF